MENVLLVLIITILAGITAAVIVRGMAGYAASLRMDERLRSAITPVRSFQARGLTGIALAAARRIGGGMKELRYAPLRRHRESVEKFMAVLGHSRRIPDADTFVGIECLAAAGAALAGLAVLSLYNPVFLAGLAVAGFFAPYGMLKERVRARREIILRQLPDVLDLLSMMVCAGLDFSTALSRITADGQGALIDELLLVQQQVRLGRSRAEALEHMAAKISLPAFSSVVKTLTLSLATGSGMARSLQALAEQFRIEQSQRAEKLASEAPLKLMMPLILLVFPTIFIILFGPILLSFMHSGF